MSKREGKFLYFLQEYDRLHQEKWSNQETYNTVKLYGFFNKDYKETIGVLS